MNRLIFVKLDNGSLYNINDVTAIENNSTKSKYTKEYIEWVKNVYAKYEKNVESNNVFCSDQEFEITTLYPISSISIGKQIVEVNTNKSAEMTNAINECGKAPQKCIIEYSLVLISGKVVEITKDDYSKILILLQDYVL